MDLSPLMWHRLDDSQQGSLVSLVLCNKGEEWISLNTNQMFSLTGTSGIMGKCATFHCWVVQSISEDGHDGHVTLTSSHASQVIVHPEPCQGDFLRFSELCAGMAGTSFGAMRAGLTPVVAMDRSELACRVMPENLFPKVLCGDVHSLHDIARFHEGHECLRAGLLIGFPCQPFSKLGSQRAFADCRAETFFRALDAAYLMQCSFLVMECVVGLRIMN